MKRPRIGRSSDLSGAQRPAVEPFETGRASPKSTAWTLTVLSFPPAAPCRVPRGFLRSSPPPQRQVFREISAKGVGQWKSGGRALRAFRRFYLSPLPTSVTRERVAPPRPVSCMKQGRSGSKGIAVSLVVFYNLAARDAIHFRRGPRASRGD